MSRSSAVVNDEVPIVAATGDLVDPSLESLDGDRKRAKVGTSADDALRLLENSERARRVDQREVGPGQLDQRLERHHRQGVGQQGSQAGRTLDELTCLAHLSAVGGCTCGCREDQCAAPITIQVPTVHDLGGAPEHRFDADPLIPLGGDQGLLGKGQGGQWRGAEGDCGVVG